MRKKFQTCSTLRRLRLIDTSDLFDATQNDLDLAQSQMHSACLLSYLDRAYD